MKPAQEAADADPHSDCGQGDCLVYPALRIAWSSRKRSFNTLVLTHDGLMVHLARPHSPTDRFEHPFWFATVGNDSPALSYYLDGCDEGRARLDVIEGMQVPEDTDEMGGLSSSLSSLAFVLDSVPNLTNLALTGVLERVFARSRPSADIRHYALRPPPLDLAAPLRVNSFAKLETLRVCDVDLTAGALLQLHCLESLKYLQWQMSGAGPPASRK